MEESARRSAALAAGAIVPDNVKQNIIAIAREEHPKKIAVLQLAGKYQQKFKKEFRPEAFGFKTANELLKKINQVELHHDEMLSLWFLTFNPNAAEEAPEPEDVEMEVAEDISANNGNSGNLSDQQENNHMGPVQPGNAQDNGIVLEVLEETEDQDMKPPDAPPPSMSAPSAASASVKDLPQAPKIPPPSPSISSSASSNASGATRSRRLPPPPPSMDWSSGSKSILGKRQGSVLGPDAKRLQLDEDMDSVCSVDESVPQQDKRKLEQDKRSHVRYIPQSREIEPLTYDTLLLGKKLGVVEPATYVDTTFCQREVLERLMEVKYEIRKAGGAPYQDLQKKLNDFANPPTVFQYNAAYLFANIDALSGFALTNPTARNGQSIVNEGELLYAVDIHGGPGGFVEYLLTKMQWEAKVYGYTYKEDAYNYKLSNTGHYPKESFEQWLGLDGIRGDGSIYKPMFVDNFARFIKRNTGGGVHVVVADGSEMTPGLDEDRKELRCKPLILAEAYIALRILREGGTFVMRLYDVFTPYTAGLIYLMYRAFDSVAIIRPETCHQGSAERFLLCKHFRTGKLCTEIGNYLQTLHGMDHGCHVNHKFPNDQQAEIVELVPVEMVRNTIKFYDYIYESNCNIGRIQLDETHNLCRALQYKHDGKMITHRRVGIRNKCADVWNCPRRLRQEPRYSSLSPELFLSKLLRPYPENVLNRTEREGEVNMTYSVMEKDFLSPQDWHFVSVGRDRGFYMGRGGDKVYRFSGGKWKQVNDQMDIADQTLMYGDIVDEITSLEENKQITQTAFHIIDGMVLGGKDIRNLPYRERMDMCNKFAKSMSKPSMPNLVLVRAKRPQEATRLEPSLLAVHKEQVKGRGDRKKRPLAPVDISDSKSPAYAHTGYLFMRTTKTGDVPSDFITTMQNRIYWKLDEHMDRNPSTGTSNRPADPKLLNATIVDASSLANHIKQYAPAPNAAK